MQIEIVTIGNEILSGRTMDTNFAFLARALEAVSVQVGWHTTVGDQSERIAEALRLALDRADAVVATGGLGPTPDDMTRKAVSTLLGRPLQLDERVLEHIKARARRTGRKLSPVAESQALIPLGAEAWPNALGTAPGILILHRAKPLILLPGVPAEMEGLAREFVVPYLRERTGRLVETFTLRTAGAYETWLHQKIGQAPQEWPGATLAYLPSYYGVDLRVTVTGTEPEQVRAITGRAYDELKVLVAPAIYTEGEQGMEDVVGEALLARGWKLATAESCTGGLLAKRLTDTAGASRYFERGFVTYSNASKVALLGVSEAALEQHGAVSEPVAQQMAHGARERAGVEVGISITGVAGPDGGTVAKPVGTVFVAVESPEGAAARRYHLPGTRRTVRERSTQMALDLLRRQLSGLPLDLKLD